MVSSYNVYYVPVYTVRPVAYATLQQKTVTVQKIGHFFFYEVYLLCAKCPYITETLLVSKTNQTPQYNPTVTEQPLVSKRYY